MLNPADEPHDASPESNATSSGEHQPPSNTPADEILRRLGESEERFRVVADTVPIGILISRVSDGVIVYANSKLGEVYRMAAEDFLGRTTLEFYADAHDRTPMLEMLQRDGKVEDWELRTVRADGSEVWLLVSARLMSYRGEQCLLSALLDLTVRKQTEKLLLEERRRLRRMVEWQEQERRLVAYEIHDGLVQDLVGAKMLLESIWPIGSPPAEDTDETLARCQQILDDGIREARRLINGLRPQVLDDAGLIAGLESLIDEVSARSGLAIEFHHDVHFDRLAPQLELAVFRTVQECLNNVWKHSGSPKARIQIEQQGDLLKLTVLDWGRGFRQDESTAGHYGLEGMQERIRLLDGRLEIHSDLGQGTCVRVEIPLLAEEANLSD